MGPHAPRSEARFVSDMKVAVVIVTYDRPTSVGECLDDVSGQTRSPDQIVVIDNSPGNQTRDMISAHFPEITYKHFPENIGSAGGFCEGLNTAVRNSDFIWVLDDDVRSEKDNLEGLLSYLPLFDEDRTVGVIRGGYGEKSGDVVEIESFAWRGTLIKTGIIETVGLPERNLFLYGSDVEYAIRIRQAGYRICGVFAGRPRETARTARERSWLTGPRHEYYQDRFRLYYAHRNETHTYLKYRKYGAVARLLVYAIRGGLLFLLKRTPENAVAIAEGVRHGFIGKLGKNEKYLPGVAMS